MAKKNYTPRAIDFIRNNKIIEDICQSYVYEYLSSVDNGGTAEWANKLNSLLDTFKDDPNFEFLKAGTDEDGNQIYKRIGSDKDSYETFKQLQFSLHDGAGTGKPGTIARRFYKKAKKLFETDEGKATLYEILTNTNEVFLDQSLKPRKDVANVAEDNLGGAVTQSIFEFGPDGGATLNLEGPGIYLFFMFVYQTAWFTKDIAQNAPTKTGATGLPNDRAELGSGVNKVIYFPYLRPVPPRTEGKEIPASYSMPKRIKNIEREASLFPLVEDRLVEDFGAGKDYISNGGTLQVLTRKELQNVAQQTSQKISFNGVTDDGFLSAAADFFAEMFTGDAPAVTDEFAADDILFYNGGTGVRGSGGTYFESIYAWNLDVITTIATLYPSITWALLKDVLKDFVEEVQQNLQSARVVLGEEEEGEKVKTPFKKVTPKPKPSALKPVEHQCYLLENVRALSEYKDLLTITKTDKYENIGTIYNSSEGGNSLPGNLISYINHANKTDEVNALLNLCPEIYALLTPHIKIYRVEYEGEDKLIPTLQQEIPFPNFIDPSDIQAIMNNDYGRFPGAGIKSFSWNLDGVNPAEIDNNISARLDLHFQTIQDLFSLNQGLAAGQEKPGYLDLIIKSARAGSKKNADQTRVSDESAALPISTECFEAAMMEYDPRDFEIKACVGWSTPANFSSIVNQLQSSRGKGDNYGKDLEAAINATRVGLYLTLTTHELNFNENGSVDLSVNYQARLSGLARSPDANIFGVTSKFKDKLKAIDSKLKQVNQDMSKKLNKYDQENRSSAALDDKEIEGLTRQKEDLLEEKIRLTKQDKAIKYKRFLNNLYRDQKIYSYVVPASRRTLLKDMTPEQRAKAARNRVETNEYLVGWNPQSDSGAAAAMYDSAAKRINELSKKVTTDKDQTDTEKGKATVGRLNLEKAAKNTNTDLKIPFFYLGDLIDSVLEYVGIVIDKEEKRGSLQLIISQVELIDPLLAYQIEKIEIECPDDKDVRILRALSEVDPMRFRGLTGIKFTTNIASMPVSLEVFQEWFINNIVKPQVDTYSVLRFIKTVCSSLISKAFNSTCFEDIDFSLRFDTAIFNFDKTFTGKTTTVNELASSKGSADRKDCVVLSKDQKPTIPTFILYSVDSRPMTGNYDKDLSTGIYHYYLGAACGIAKKISFSRNDLPYYRESRLQRKSALSAVQLRELYNASIQMVGNNLHKNGQYIYVNPIAIGAGSMQQKGSLPNLARLLGIGGYYMVTKVSHDISSAGFNVSIDAIQEGIDFSGTGNSVTQLVPYSGQEILNPRSSGN
mgnify:CR=1 FL=1|tara:strand:+ start:1685 stop:5563 length:3879 start_codon:yes stop_codon:yes gene_type:complete